MKNTLQETYEILQKHPNWILVGHYGADGDCLGSLLSLYGILKAAGKNVIAYHPEPILGIENRFSSLPNQWITRHLQPDNIKGDYKICAVDCGDLSRISAKGLRQKPFSALFSDFADVHLQIDHHITNTLFAKHNLVMQASSTVEILHKLLLHFEKGGVNLAEAQLDVMNSIWVGLVTDTGSFGYSSAGADSHSVAQDLIQRGVDPGFWRAQLFGRNSLGSLKAEAKMLDRSISLLDGKLLVGVINHEMLKSSGLTPDQGQDGADKLRDVEGVQIGLSIRFLGFGKPWKISSRTNNPNIDLSKLALKYGGGGHPGASGWMWENRPKILIEALQKDCIDLYPEVFKNKV